MENTLVLYPSPGIGHLISMVELGKLILKHHPSFSITVVITTLPFPTKSTAPYIESVSATTPSVSFYHLPTLPPPMDPSSPLEIPFLLFEIPRLDNPKFHETLCKISETKHINGVIIDFFCSVAMEVTKELSLPTYYFFTSGAYALAMFLYTPTLDKNTTKSLKDMNTILDDHIPGFPPIHSSEFPSMILDRTKWVYDQFVKSAEMMREASGLIINTFEDFEKKAIKMVNEGWCVPAGVSTPPVYCIGPLIKTGTGEEHDCLSWLDSQPSRSVLFLCFGSMGLFSEKQIKEIAIGLEKSGVRFLWVVRIPPPTMRTLADGESKPLSFELDDMLPLGFMERTKERGYVVKDWVPQVDVLSHGSVGGFVTHCGWNSVLESVCAGVPMLSWPLYAEQKLNRVILVKEIKVALELKKLEDGFVTATELEERVRELMDSANGKIVRKRVEVFRDGATMAMNDGGSSREGLAKLIECFKAI